MSSIEQVESVLHQHYGTNIVRQVKAGLATIATLALKENNQPVTLIYVGPSGSGKTLDCSLLTPDNDHEELRQHIIRVDKFTPKSFVSHAANVKANQLSNIDLLPKIENRCLITKELAPLFRGNKDDLQENFSILISVLDGRGYVSSSGVRGTRGYDRELTFSWLGATTPFTNEVHRLMAQLGTRLVFYNTEVENKSTEDLLEFAKKGSHSDAEQESRHVCNEFLKRFFVRNELKSIEESVFNFPEEFLRDLVRYAQLMCFLRAGFSMKKGRDETRYSKPDREVPYRAITILKSIAYGSALIHGRPSINEFDLEQIQHIAYSSMPEQRRLIFQALVRNDGSLTVRETMEKVGMSRPTALHYMEELAHLGVCNFERGGIDQTVSQIELLDDWKWAVRDDELPGQSETVSQSEGVYAEQLRL